MKDLTLKYKSLKKALAKELKKHPKDFRVISLLESAIEKCKPFEQINKK